MNDVGKKKSSFPFVILLGREYANFSLESIQLFTRIEFVGVVSLFGKGLLRANAAQLQKIVNSTRYSKGLDERFIGNVC